MKSLPKSELAEWWHDHFFYYKPASEKELMPISFDVEDEELYSKEEKSAYYESNRSDVIRGTK